MLPSTPAISGVRELCTLQTVGPLAKWAEAIPPSSWGGTYMRSGAWNDFDEQARPVVEEAMKHYPGKRCYGVIVSGIPPNDPSIAIVHPHVDAAHPDFLTRVHIPLQTNPGSLFYSEDVPWHMAVGTAYEVDIRRMHHNHNPGPKLRIHFWFDVLS